MSESEACKSALAPAPPTKTLGSHTIGLIVILQSIGPASSATIFQKIVQHLLRLDFDS